ncbi:MAG: SCO family protein, partial [Chromatiales bacterium]|nr:SCO family protein [Chromatiales bacterium]
IAALFLSANGLQREAEEEQAAVAPPAELASLLLPEAIVLQPFSLTDHNGNPLGLEQLKGQWTLLFFGYTHCPDVCPTTLGMLKGVAMRLAAEPQPEKTRFLFVSVDPKRDTTAHLADYIDYFHKDFIAASGERSEIDNFTRQLGAIYLFDGDTEGDEYHVNHSASVALIDPQGVWVARINPPHTVNQLHTDYLQLRNYLKTTTHQE